MEPGDSMQDKLNKIELVIILLIVSVTFLGVIVGIGFRSVTPTARLPKITAIEDPALNLTPAPNCLITGVLERLTPTPTLTPTATPTGPVGKKLSGRFYLGTWRGRDGGNVGRNAVSQSIPPPSGPEIHIDIPITPLPNGIQTLQDVANWPNTSDVCSQLTSDGSVCGWLGVNVINGKNYPKYPHCSTYGGFSLTIPDDARISYCGNEPYYGFIIRPVDPRWRVSEAYMMDVSTSITPIPNKRFAQFFDYEATGDHGIRCDCFNNDVYKAGRGECRLPDNSPQCNTCIKRAYGLDPSWGYASVWANMGVTCGNIYGYTPANPGKVFIPVSWVGKPNMELWIGVYQATPTPVR